MEISDLETFKKELEIIPITIGNLIGLVDNYIRLKKELADRDNEIKCLKVELDSLSAENINFNNVSLVKQQDKLVNDLQIEIAYLKKQVAKYISTGGNGTLANPPSPKLATSTPLTDPAPQVVETEHKPNVKSRGRKSTKSKVEAEPVTADVLVASEPKPVEIIPPTPPAKRTRKKKTDTPVSATTTQDSAASLPVESIPEKDNIVAEGYAHNAYPKGLGALAILPEAYAHNAYPKGLGALALLPEPQPANEVAPADAIMPDIDVDTKPQCESTKIDEEVNISKDNEPVIEQNEDKNEKIVGSITLSYDEPISINEQIPETPDVDDMDDIITINSVKYWLYNNLLFQFISNNKAGSFIRKYEEN
jgi:hypothetical protein